MKALVLGYGRSGKSAEALAKVQGCEVTVFADDVHDSLSSDYDFAIVSPGVALTHPWIVACQARGIPFKSELQFGCEELKRRGWKLLAVTGSKGKSSVVKVVADAINLAGGYAVPCGNYGTPVSEVARSSPPSSSPWAVVEVSSFMMETTDLPHDTFEAAVILNLQEDHLDRHGTVEVYHALKLKLLTMAKVGANDLLTRNQKDETSLLTGSYFDNPVLGENGAWAIKLMRVAGLSDAQIAATFRGFKPLPHRLNLITELNGVYYVDDSKATSLAALEAGVKMVRPRPDCAQNVRLIAGGLPKGDDPKNVLSILTKRVKKVYLIGQSAEFFASAWKVAVDCKVCGTLEKAVARVMCEAEKGETVLLSPGTASYDQFKSFEERGDVFADLVKRQRIKEK